MKLLFRFFRGEFNGIFARAFLLSRNNAVQDMLDELVYHATVVWKLPGDESAGESPIREEDIVNLAKFAGIPRPLQYVENTVGSLRFTSSNVVGGKQRSERGLFNTVKEGFDFVRTANDSYSTDIATEASGTKRMSMVPEGTAPVGYVPHGVSIFEEDGTLIPGNILSEPPTDGTPYTPYYGEKYLFTEETFITDTEMRIDMFMAYYECIMRIRRSGASVVELLYLTELFGEGYIKDLEIEQVSWYYILHYSLSDDIVLANKSGRLAAWRTIMSKRFKDFILSENVA